MPIQNLNSVNILTMQLDFVYSPSTYVQVAINGRNGTMIDRTNTVHGAVMAAYPELLHKNYSSIEIVPGKEGGIYRLFYNNVIGATINTRT